MGAFETGGLPSFCAPNLGAIPRKGAHVYLLAALLSPLSVERFLGMAALAAIGSIVVVDGQEGPLLPKISHLRLLSSKLLKLGLLPSCPHVPSVLLEES